MKKLIIALVLAGGVTAFAFAALDSSSAVKDSKKEKKQESKKKKDCMHTCMYAI